MSRLTKNYKDYILYLETQRHSLKAEFFVLEVLCNTHISVMIFTEHCDTVMILSLSGRCIKNTKIFNLISDDSFAGYALFCCDDTLTQHAKLHPFQWPITSTGNARISNLEIN